MSCISFILFFFTLDFVSTYVLRSQQQQQQQQQQTIPSEYQHYFHEQLEENADLFTCKSSCKYIYQKCMKNPMPDQYECVGLRKECKKFCRLFKKERRAKEQNDIDGILHRLKSAHHKDVVKPLLQKRKSDHLHTS